MRKNKLFILTATFALLSTFTYNIAQADSTIKVSFVLINPITGLNAGAGSGIGVRAVNRDGGDPPNARTNNNGVVTFTLKPKQYTLTGSCGICYADKQGQFITHYLVHVVKFYFRWLCFLTPAPPLTLVLFSFLHLTIS